jgi:hypothetical protein
MVGIKREGVKHTVHMPAPIPVIKKYLRKNREPQSLSSSQPNI